MALEYFLNMYVQPILVIIGLAGNLINVLVFSRKKFSKLATRNILKLIAIIDSFCLLQILDHFFKFGFGFYLRRDTDFACKFFTYLIYSFGPMSAWLLVFISVERFVSITMPTSKIGLVFKHTSFQIKVFCIICIFNLIYYSPFLVLVENKCVLARNNPSNLSNSSLIDTRYCCDFVDYNSQNILSLMDAFNSSLVPFFLMLLSSVLIISSIFRSRFRLKHAQTAQKEQQKQNRKRLKRDVQFAITSIYMNVLFIAFNLPVCVTLFYNDNITSLIYLIMVDTYYSSYVINFFIYLAFNSLFREEFLVMIKIRKPHL